MNGTLGLCLLLLIVATRFADDTIAFFLSTGGQQCSCAANHGFHNYFGVARTKRVRRMAVGDVDITPIGENFDEGGSIDALTWPTEVGVSALSRNPRALSPRALALNNASGAAAHPNLLVLDRTGGGGSGNKVLSSKIVPQLQPVPLQGEEGSSAESISHQAPPAPLATATGDDAPQAGAQQPSEGGASAEIGSTTVEPVGFLVTDANGAPADTNSPDAIGTAAVGDAFETATATNEQQLQTSQPLQQEDADAAAAAASTPPAIVKVESGDAIPGAEPEQNAGGNAANAAAGGGAPIVLPPRCNSATFHRIISENTPEGVKPNVVKRDLQKLAFAEVGGRVDVVCSLHPFSYIVNSDEYCEVKQNGIICLIYKQGSEQS